jgi:hypothetical protein
MANSLYQHYVGHCSLFKVHWIYTMFRKMTLFSSSGDWLSLYCQIQTLFFFIGGLNFDLILKNYAGFCQYNDNQSHENRSMANFGKFCMSNMLLALDNVQNNRRISTTSF